MITARFHLHTPDTSQQADVRGNSAATMLAGGKSTSNSISFIRKSCWEGPRNSIFLTWNSEISKRGQIQGLRPGKSCESVVVTCPHSVLKPVLLRIVSEGAVIVSYSEEKKEGEEKAKNYMEK